jgi:hypothetical protein
VEAAAEDGAARVVGEAEQGLVSQLRPGGGRELEEQAQLGEGLAVIVTLDLDEGDRQRRAAGAKREKPFFETQIFSVVISVFPQAQIEMSHVALTDSLRPSLPRGSRSRRR